MKALVTGVSGFAGSHLAEYLLQRNVEVVGTIRAHSCQDQIQHLVKNITLMECELRDAQPVHALIASVRPDMIFHLAAQSYVPRSWSTPMDTIHNNIAGELNILEAVRHLNLNTKIHLACSSEQYGHVEPHEIPIKETNPMRPLSPYAVSKATQELLGYQYQQSYGIHIVTTRTFHHTGPRRGEEFVTSNFCKQIAEIEKGMKAPIIYVGNLDAKRDFTDVRDVVRAYWLALEKGVPGEVYNVASGSCRSIREMLAMLLSKSHTPIQVEVDPKRLRPSDGQILVGDYSKFNQHTGWKPEISFEQTLLDLLNYWRQRV